MMFRIKSMILVDLRGTWSMETILLGFCLRSSNYCMGFSFRNATQHDYRRERITVYWIPMLRSWVRYQLLAHRFFFSSFQQQLLIALCPVMDSVLSLKISQSIDP